MKNEGINDDQGNKITVRNPVGRNGDGKCHLT